MELRQDVSSEELAKREFFYLPLLDRRGKKLAIHRLMVQQPGFYVSVLCVVFGRASGEATPPTDQERHVATASYRLLNDLAIVPSQSGDEVDFDSLIAWCLEVRRLSAIEDRTAIANQYIGHVLAHAPRSSKDGAWPHEAIRAAIDQLQSDEIERGVTIERHNMRGAYSKAIGEGGVQERALAAESRGWAGTMPDYPRTAAMLFRIADDWEKQGTAEDLRAEIDRLRR